MSGITDTPLGRFFTPDPSTSPEQMFGLNRKVRLARLREMLSIVRRYHVREGITPKQFRAILEELGPSFIKVGQILSTRSEILPQEYCDELSLLQMDCEPMPFETVMETLRGIYGNRLEEIFEHIDQKPLGSASLAQVHRATLANGDTVAIKVQRPGVRITMAQDIDTMRSLARRASRFIRGNQIVDLTEVVEELWKIFLEETDFKREALNLEEFAANNADVAFIRCPKPYLEYCTPEILVMEYIDGIPIYESATIEEQDYDLKEIGEKILDNYATQILDHGFFHADPHPGNIVVAAGQVVYLDLGNMGRLTLSERAEFAKIIEAVGRQNSSMLKEALIAFSTSGDTGAIDHPQLLAALDVVLDQYASIDVAEIDIGAFLTDIMVLMRECKITLPSCLTSVSRGLVSLEGTLLRYAGSFNIVDIINNHIMNSRNIEIDMKAFARDAAIRLENATRSLDRATQDVGDSLRMLTRGQIKFNMEVLGSEGPMNKLSHIMNRLVVGLMVAGMLVGASLVAGLDAGPQVFGMHAISFMLYAVAFVMFVWVIVDIFRSRRGGL